MKKSPMLKKLFFLIALLALLSPGAFAQALGTINTVAGGVPNNLPALSVGISYPTAVVKDSSGNLYVAVEGFAFAAGGVFKINPSGTLTTFVGNGTLFASTGANNGDGGPATNATLGFVTGLFLDSQQNLYISDNFYGTIRKVTASTGIITTIAGGGTGCTSQTDPLGDGCPATSAILSVPYQIFVDANQNLFIADSGNSRIREVVASTGLMQTVAGGGTGCPNQSDTVGDGCAAALAILSGPFGVYLDSQRDIFISDRGNSRIREVSASTGLIQTVAGTGTPGYNGDGIAANTAQISSPYSLFVDPSGNVFFSDVGNSRIREIVASSSLIQTIAGGGFGCSGQTDSVGDGCPASSATLLAANGVFVDASNDLYIADSDNSLVREVVASDGVLASTDTIQAVAGNGTVFFSGDGLLATSAQLNVPYGVAVDASGNLFIADTDSSRIRKVSATTGIIQTVAGGGTGCTAQTDSFGDGCPAAQAVLIEPIALFVDSAGDLFISDYGHSRIREVSASTGIITTVVGGGTGCTAQTDTMGDGCPATQATLSLPWGVYVDPNGNIFFSDFGNSRIRKVVASTGLIQTIAGTGTAGYNGDNIPAVQAQISSPIGVYGDAAGDIFISDQVNFRIREIYGSTPPLGQTAGNIVTVAGTGTPGYNGDNILATSAEIIEPEGIFVDRAGNLFFGDFGNYRIREVVASTGLIETVAGNGTLGFSGDGGPATSAEVTLVGGVAGDPSGNLLLADTYSLRIRKVYGIVPANTFTITTNTLPLAQVGVPYSFALQTAEGTPPLTWSLLSGALPPGLSQLSAAGVISGMPTTVGTYSFTVQVADSASHVLTRPLTLTVIPASVTLQSLTVTPANPTLATHTTQTFLAIGTYNDGSTQNLSAAVTWSSSSTTVATISSSGVATGVSAGTSTISATLGNVAGSTALTVTAKAPYAYIGSVVSANCCLDALDTSTNQVVKSIPVTALNEPFGITPDQSRIYLADNVNNLVNVVDTTTNTLVTSIPVGSGATAVAITPNGLSGYVADYGDTNVSVFSVATNSVVKTVPIGFASGWLTASPDGAFVYVGSAVDNRVAVINTSTNVLSSTFTIAPPAGQLTAACIIGPAFNPASTLGYFLQSCASTTAPGSVSVLSIPNNVTVATIPVGILPYDLALTPDGSRLYVVNARSNSVSVIDTANNTVIATVPVGNAPQSIAVTPDGTLVYVPNAKDSTLSLIQTSTNTVTATVPLTVPFGIVMASPPAASQATTLTLTPPNLIFNSQLTGTASAAQTIDVSNPGSSSVTLSSVALTGPNTSDFTLVNSCPKPPATLAGGATCGLQVGFSPTATGARTAFVTIIGTNGLASSTQSAPLTGQGIILVSIALTPLTPVITVNGTVQFTVTGTYSDNSAQPLTSVSWTSSPSSVASISSLGLATGLTHGTATISATVGNIAGSTTLTVQALAATFIGLTPSQAIFAGTSSVTLGGTIGSGTTHPAPAETVSITLNNATQTVAIGSNGTFSTAFPTGTIPASATPYTITYSYAGDTIFAAATDTSTTLTVNPVVSQFLLTVTDIGTGNGTVTDNFEKINCTTTAGVQSGACSASYANGTPVTLTASPSGNSTFAAWGGACTGSANCLLTMTAPQTATASFVPPPQLINLTFNPGTTVTGMATYDCPSNPSPSPDNPCTDPNAHALALAIPQVLQPFTVTVQASELPPSVADGICPNGLTPTQDFDCRFVTFFTYQTLDNGNKVVPLCYPYANGNCVHYQVFSGTPGVEPNPSFYVGPIDWSISWNNDQFTPPAPYTGSTPHLYDDPDYAVSPTSPYGTDCTQVMLVGNPPSPTNPPISCQFEFDITTSFNPTKKVDALITGRTKQFNDVVVAFPPANVGNLTVAMTPTTGTVTAGSPLSFTIAITNSAGGPVTGATLTGVLPAGTNVLWTISPAYTGPGTCAITGASGSQVLNCSFGTISASQAFTIGLLSANSSIGSYSNTATLAVGTQQILSIGAVTVQAVPASFSGLTPSQSILFGATSITVGGTIGNGTTFPAPGEVVSITINGATQTATIGSNGTFSIAFPTATIPASVTPYPITYSFAGDAIFSAVTYTSTTLTVNTAPVLVPLRVTLIGTGNGTVTDNFEQINCTTTAGVQSGTCSANYASGTIVTLTATPSGNSTFAAWGSACTGTASCSLTMITPQSVTASFVPPPQAITLTFTPGTNVSGMATYDCPSNPAPSPGNPCTDPNAHALALAIPQVLQPFTVTVQASEVPLSIADGICPNGLTPTQDFDCRFATFFTYQTLPNGNKVVPLCYPYANGNCVHYQVYSGTPGVEPNPSFYVGPIDWSISWNNDQFTPPAPYTGSTPHLYDDPDYAVSPTSPYGTDCTQVMLVGNPPLPTNPPISCQFEFDITTSFNPTKKVDALITGRTKQFNDVAVAFPPANVGNLTVTDAPLATPVTAGSPLSFTIAISNSAGGAVSGATLTDVLPAGTNVLWTISPAYTGPGTCGITGAAGSQVLNCSFGTISASQSFTIGLLSANSSSGTYTDTATVVVGTQQILSIGTLTVNGSTASNLVISPSSVDFGQVVLGFFSLKSVTLSNKGTAAIAISKVSLTSAGKGEHDDFYFQSFCPKNLAPGKNCTVLVEFVPDDDDVLLTTQSAALLITDSADGSPQSVPLTASVINPRASFSTRELHFGPQQRGTTSAPESVTLTNSGTSPLVLKNVTTTGDYALAAGTTCAAGTNLVPSQSCTLLVTFTPKARGRRLGTIAIADNTLFGKDLVLLNGTGN
jgi:uncharacterized repeat protein (TIGR01451 family)